MKKPKGLSRRLIEGQMPMKSTEQPPSSRPTPAIAPIVATSLCIAGASSSGTELLRSSPKVDLRVWIDCHFGGGYGSGRLNRWIGLSYALKVEGWVVLNPNHTDNLDWYRDYCEDAKYIAMKGEARK